MNTACKVVNTCSYVAMYQGMNSSTVGSASKLQGFPVEWMKWFYVHTAGYPDQFTLNFYSCIII